MRMGIATWYGVTNYGSALQAYALQPLIAQTGHESVTEQHNVHEPQSASGKCSRAQRYRTPSRLTHGRRVAALGELAKTEAVAKFRVEDLSITKEYLDRCEVDLAIIGSDQIIDIRNYREFQFGVGVRTSRVSKFAPSFGETILEDGEASEHLGLLREAVRGFSDVSARDANSQTILETLTGWRVEAILELALVFKFVDERLDWRVEGPEGRCAAIYSLGGATTTREFSDAVRNMARRNGIKTVSIGGRRPWGDVNFATSSPQEFFSLISIASVVVTNMFHGSCFAIRAGMPLVSLVMPHNANKFGDLLNRLGLGARRLDDVAQIADSGPPEIGYEATRRLLDQGRASSRTYLDAVLTGQVGAA